jgi:hypothetical protein
MCLLVLHFLSYGMANSNTLQLTGSAINDLWSLDSCFSLKEACICELIRDVFLWTI